MLRYVSLPNAAKTHVSTFFKNDTLKLSKNLLQYFRIVWEHPQPNWKLARHVFWQLYVRQNADWFCSHLHPAVADTGLDHRIFFSILEIRPSFKI